MHVSVPQIESSRIEWIKFIPWLPLCPSAPGFPIGPQAPRTCDTNKVAYALAYLTALKNSMDTTLRYFLYCTIICYTYIHTYTYIQPWAMLDKLQQFFTVPMHKKQHYSFKDSAGEKQNIPRRSMLMFDRFSLFNENLLVQPSSLFKYFKYCIL